MFEKKCIYIFLLVDNFYTLIIITSSPSKRDIYLRIFIFKNGNDTNLRYRNYRVALRAVSGRDKTTKPFFLAISLFHCKYKAVCAEKKGYFVSVTYADYVLIPLFNTPFLDCYTPTVFSAHPHPHPCPSAFLSLLENAVHMSLYPYLCPFVEPRFP